MAERAHIAAPDARTRRLVAILASAQGALFATLGLARYWTFHNETFDLAFYTRIAWGLVRVDYWEPMVNAHIYGLHLSPILAPLGALGLLTDTATVLILAQAAALALAAFPLARIGVRHLGPAGALAGAIAWLFYPNLGHVAGYEFHPGSLAALPLAWMALAIDDGRARPFVLGALGVLACREDLALVVVLAAILFALRHRAQRRVALAVGVVALAYLLFFALVLHPAYAPPDGSLQLHFGRFGSSIGEVAAYLLTHPGELLAHLSTEARLLYLPKVLAPLAFLPLLRPRWLLPAAPLLAINLVSDWPTSTDLAVHYLTPALPFMVAGALEGAGALRARAPMVALLSPVLPVLVGHVIAGGTPLALDFDAAAYRPDRDTVAARAIVRAIPPDASVQAPYPLLPHLAERRTLHRASSPEANDRFYVLNVAHRRRFRAREDLLRTFEEPTARDWMARDDHRLAYAGGDYLLLERGHPPRTGLGGAAIVGRDDPESGQRIAACLAVRAARLYGDDLELDFVARDACPNDLAIRVGVAERAPRVDLLFAGHLSPRHLRRGDLVRSRHRLSPELKARILERGLRVGALRESGARPEHADPMSVNVPLLVFDPGG